MRPACWGALLVLALTVPAPVARSQSPAENLQKFEQVWRTTRDHFYDPKLSGLDWRSVGERYRDEAEQAKSKREFQNVIERMLAELHASHLDYYTDDDFEYYLLQSVFKNDMEGEKAEHIGVLGERADDGFVVRAVLDGSPAAKARIVVGDRLLTADGAPFTTVGSFRGKAGSEVALELDRPAKGRMTIDVVPVRENPQRAFLEATKRSVRVIEFGGKRLGYIHLWTMTNDALQRALVEALTHDLADTDGLILDIRDGFGGRPYGYTDVLFRPDVQWGQSARSQASGGDVRTTAGSRESSSHTGYSKPLVLLINQGSRSAKEYFAYQIKKSGRGALVGTTTAGAFLGAGGYSIGSDGYLELPVMGLTLDGKRIEGVGVSPDITEPDEHPYSADDRQLRRAMTVLLDKIRAQPRKTDFVAP